MKVLILLMTVPAVFASFDEYWITSCGHVYKKTAHPMKIIQNAHTLLRLKHHFKQTQEFLSTNEQLGILEDLAADPESDLYVVPPTTLAMYDHVKDVRRLLSLLPMTYRTLQDLAFALHVVEEELVVKGDEEFKARHSAVVELMDKNAQLLCELDYAMNRNNMEFSRIDQLTLSQDLSSHYQDLTYTHMKHSYILKEYRTFIKHVSSKISKFV